MSSIAPILISIWSIFAEPNWSDRLWDRLNIVIGRPATSEQRDEAAKSLSLYSRHYGFQEQEIYRIIEMETGGSFHLRAWNNRTDARGLMQITPIAILQVPAGQHLVRFPRDVFSPKWNILAGVQYYKYCWDRASPKQIGRLYLSRDEVAKIYYVAGRSRAENALFTSLDYAIGDK